MIDQNSFVRDFSIDENIRLRKLVSVDPEAFQEKDKSVILDDFLLGAKRKDQNNSDPDFRSQKLDNSRFIYESDINIENRDYEIQSVDQDAQNVLEKAGRDSSSEGSENVTPDSKQSTDKEEEEVERTKQVQRKPRRNSWTNLTGINIARILSKGQQTKMLAYAHLKEYSRTSPICIIVVACLFYWFMCMIALSLSPLQTDDDALDMAFTRPLYPAFRYHNETDKWSYTQEVIKEQEQKWEGFFQYINQTNTKRTDDNGKRVNSWTPFLDVMSPAIFYPVNCFPSDTQLYNSPVVAYIKSDSDLQSNLIEILKSQFEDQRALQKMMYEILDWLYTVEIDEIFDFVGMFVDAERLEEFKESELFHILKAVLKDPKALEEKYIDLAGYVEMPQDFKSVAVYGGGLYIPEFQYPSRILKNFGQFQFREFDSKEEMFNYVTKDGYGWDEDKPGICFAFHWHQDDLNQDYELELFFRDHFDARLSGTFSTDMPASPRFLSFDQTWALIKSFNGGMQNMQAYGANLILQKLTGNHNATIINAIAPIKIRWEGVYKPNKPYLLIFPFVFSMIYFYGMLPFYLYFAYSIVSEKEQGVRAKLLSSGMTYKSYFMSWQITMFVINLIITLLITVPLYFAVLRGWNFLILFFVFLLCGQTIIGLIWTVQSLYNSARLSAVYAGFVYGASFVFSNMLRQQMPFISKIRIILACLAPMTAVKHTLDSYSKAMEGNYAIDFKNASYDAFNFSTSNGLIMLAIDFVLYNFIGYQIDQFFYSPEESQTRMTAPLRYIRKQKASDYKVSKREEREVNEDVSVRYPTTRNLLVNNLTLSKIKFRNTLRGMFTELKVSPDQDKLFYSSQADYVSQLSQKGSVKMSEIGKYMKGEGLSFEMRKSQIMCFLGGFEQDTSNILKAICGKLEVESNQVFLNGRDINRVNKSFITSQVSYCQADDYTLFEKLTASENIQIFSRMSTRSNFYEISVISNKFIDQTKLVEQLDQAERSMLQLLITLLCLQKQILVLDEPTLYFTQEEREEAIKLIKSYKNGRFVLIKCSSDPTLIDLLADKYVVFPLDPSMKIKVHKYSSNKKANRLFRAEFQDIDKLPKLISFLRKYFQDATFQITSIEGKSCSIVCTSDGTCGLDELNHKEIREKFSVTRFEENPEDIMQEYKHIFASPANLFRLNRSIKQEQKASTAEQKISSMHISTIESQGASQVSRSQRIFKFFTHSRLIRLKQGVSVRNQDPCCMQFKFYLKQMRAQNRHNIFQYISTYLFPALLVIIGYLSSRYYYIYDSESRVMSTDWLPLQQPILVNNETVIDQLPTSQIMEYFSDYESSFQPIFARMNRTADNFYWYRDRVYYFSTVGHTSQNENQGNYFFYKMDKENHDYQMMTFFNLTTYHSMNLFPQFAYEATLRYATGNPSLNFKVRSSPLPRTADITKSYFKGEELFNVQHSLFLFQNALAQGTLATQVLIVVGLAYMIIGTAIIVTVLSERPQDEKETRTKSSSWKVTTNENTNKFAYWTAHYLNDLTYFIPCTVILIILIMIFDSYMKVAMICIVIFPFNFLPLLYVFSYTCKEERKAIFGVAMFLLLVLTFGGMFLMIRIPPPFEVFGDAFYDWSKYFPTFNLSRSIMYNGKMLQILDQYRERSKTGLGDSIDPDEWSMNNGKGDIVVSVIQIIVWWVFLLVFIELGVLNKIFCCKNKGKQEEIMDTTTKIQVQEEIQVKQEPRSLNPILEDQEQEIEEQIEDESQSDLSDKKHSIQLVSIKDLLNKKFEPRTASSQNHEGKNSETMTNGQNVFSSKQLGIESSDQMVIEENQTNIYS